MSSRKRGPRAAVEQTPARPRSRVLLAVIAAVVVIATASLIVWRKRTPVVAQTSPATDVILVTIDTLRADATGFGGNARVKTPFLDALAARGAVFTNAHAHNVVTLPSHTNILTGLYPFQHGVRDNAGFVLEPRFETVATMLRRSGFATGAFVAAFPLDARFGLNQGFDVYDDNYGKGQASFDFSIQERRADAVLRAAVSWWGSNQGKKRFMWVHLYDPHAPYAPPEPFASEYRDSPYLGEIAYTDHALASALGPLLAAAPDALVIVTGDHGEALGDHGEKTHGLFAYESTLKIPLVVAGHGVAPRRDGEPVRHVDIVPTILEAAGAPPMKEAPGVSLLHEGVARDTYFEALSASLNRGWAPLTGVIQGAVKYIDLPVAELYDLPADPKEQRNLADERRRDVDAARKLLAPMLAGASTQTRNVSGESMAKLRSLGYLAGNAQVRTDYTAADDPKNLIALDNKLHDTIDAFEHHDTQRALRLAREVVRERPDMAAGREMLALMLRQEGQLGEAIVELEQLCARPGATDDNRVQLALLLSETGQASRAEKLLAPFASSTNPDVLNAYGVSLADQAKVAPALAQFRRVLSLDPNNAPAHQNIGIVALRGNDVAAAQASLERALQLNPRLPLALNALGVVRARRNDFAGAVDAWRQAVALDAAQFDALFNIGLVESRAGRYADARKALEQFVRTAPQERYGRDIAAARGALAQMPR